MSSNARPQRRSFKAIEKDLTKVILADLLLFFLVMAISVSGITWLKMIVGILTVLISAAGDLFLVLINEHRRGRSRWMMAAFAAIGLCALFSLLTGAPFPGK